MSKLLETRLPTELQPSVTKENFNRLTRILELNLGAFDPNSTPQFNDTELGSLKFNEGGMEHIYWSFTGLYWKQMDTASYA